MTVEPELPQGWAATTIRQLSRPVKQVNPATLGHDAFEYIEVSGLNNAAHAISSTATTPAASAPSRARQLVEGGDIIFSSVRVYLENIAIVPDELAGAIASTAFCVVRAMPGVSSLYLFHFLTWQKTIRALTERQRGNSPPAINEAEFFDYEVPLAPCAEQARIVSRIEELFSDLDKGEENLRRARAQLGRYRQSVLKAAVTGELTRAWREQNADKLESGEALLRHILKARRAAWEKAELEKMRAKGKLPLGDAWKTRYVEPQGPNTEGLPELPQGWAWATVEQLASGLPRSIQSGPFGSNLLHSEFQDHGVLAIGIDNVREGAFTLGSQNRISQAKYQDLAKYTARPLDFVITVMATVGRCAVLPKNLETAIITKHVYRVTLNTELFSPYFLMWCFLGGPSVKSQVDSQMRGQTRPGINGEILKQVAVPVPSCEEQAAILDAIETRLADLEAFGANIGQALRSSSALRQSILKAAFSGKLVPQDPNDEPASELLKRIAAERAAQGARPARSAAPRRRKARADARESTSAPAAAPGVAASAATASSVTPRVAAPSAAAASLDESNRAAAQLVAARKAAGLSQAKLAERAGINQAYVSQMETGKRAITAEQAAALARALGLEPSALTQA